MRNRTGSLWCGLAACVLLGACQGRGEAINPVIHADVPDMAMIRVGKSYYMSSTTMHLSPGLPLMKSDDLVNWRILNYAYETLGDHPALTLRDGKSAYGAGSWASSLRYHKGVYYVTTFAGTTGRTYIYKSSDIEKGEWQEISFAPRFHDHTLFFDDDDTPYLIYGCGHLRIVELNRDLSGVKAGGVHQTLIENATRPVSGGSAFLGAEGSQLFKVNGEYYLFNIAWPHGGMRTTLVHRSRSLMGPYEGRIVLQDKGVAQGGLVDTPDGKWYAYLFQDCGAVGRVPFMVPVRWEDGWPVLGVDGKVPMKLAELPASRGLAPGIVASDEFERGEGEAELPLVWQWNHNPDNSKWSVKERPGWLRITSGRVDRDVLAARNMLTQRTIGPVCSGEVALDVSGLKRGDCAGLMLLQKHYGWIGVKVESGGAVVAMVGTEGEGDGVQAVEMGRVAMKSTLIYLKAECDFRDCRDVARFYYSFDGSHWQMLGREIKMLYTLPHFMGYRFGLFNYATEQHGGHADFDYFRIAGE